MSKKTFKIDNVLYPSDKIENVIEVFKEFQIVFDQASGVLQITIDGDPQYVFDEFMNYLLTYINE